MLERWNIGKMGFGLRLVEPTLRPGSPMGWTRARRENWKIGLMAKFVLTKNNNGITSLKKPTIPSFHYSIIP
jgi:hypothetical protein